MKFTAFLLAVIIAGGLFGYLFVKAVRQEATGTTDVEPVPENIFQTDVSAKINQREVNGQIPVQVVPENYGRDDPFAKF